MYPRALNYGKIMYINISRIGPFRTCVKGNTSQGTTFFLLTGERWGLLLKGRRCSLWESGQRFWNDSINLQLHLYSQNVFLFYIGGTTIRFVRFAYTCTSLNRYRPYTLRDQRRPRSPCACSKYVNNFHMFVNRMFKVSALCYQPGQTLL